jgi:integrase/recombinase XerC
MSGRSDIDWLAHEGAVHRYLQWLASERRLALNSQLAYQGDLALLKQTLALPVERETLAGLGHAQMKQALGRLRAGGLAATSLARVLSSWRGFYRYLVDRESLAGNPCAGLSAPKAEKRLPSILTAEQAINLLTAIAQTDEETQPRWQTLRDSALFELAYSSGLRVSELTNLNIAQLDLAGGEVRVLGKGSKTRVVPIGTAAVKAIGDWVNARDAAFSDIASTDSDALFLAATGKRLTPRAVQLSIKRYAKAAGITVDVHPHMLRHSCASHVLQSAQDLRAVQELLGHASIASTQVYTHLDFAHLAKVYDAAHPRAKRTK